MKLLIVKLSAFGDIIHALPALDDILQQPHVDEIHWLVDQRYEFVTEVFPARVHVHCVDMKGKHPIRSVWQNLAKLRAMKFDAVIDLQGLIKSALLARACGSPVFAFDQRFLREKPAALLTRNVHFHAQDKHVVQQYRRITAAALNSIHSTANNAPEHAIAYAAPNIHLPSSRCRPDEGLLDKLQLAHQSYVILHTAGGWATKQLPEKTWLSIAHGLSEQGILPVFSWGSAAESEQANNLATRSNAYALPERLNMSALCTLIQGCKAVIGADTGLLHLAAALHQPTITFWGPSASWNSAPLNITQNDSSKGVKHWHIESNPNCGPCFNRTCKQFVCMDNIHANSILRIFDEL